MTTTFAAGTRILTDHGEVSVEALRDGDSVETVSGAWRPVVFLGRRRVDCGRHPTPREVYPVRVRAGAFTDDVPRRDLLLSPDHAVYIDDVLIPIRSLINGATIVQVAVDEIVYWHVELSEQDVLFAESLPCETCPDDRTAFENSGTVMQLHPCFTARDGGFAPLVTAGDRLVAIRDYLIDRSGRQAREMEADISRIGVAPGNPA
jgi:hypothetical protein